MVGMDEIWVYIPRRQNTIAQYIATGTIMDLCLAAEWKPGLRRSRQWWEQPTLYILGIRAGHVSVKVGGETGTEESEVEVDGEYGREGWRGGD